MSAAGEIASRFAAVNVPPPPPPKPSSLTPAQLAARSERAAKKLARLEELLAGELARHRRQLRTLRTKLRKARSTDRYYRKLKKHQETPQ